MVYTLQAFFFEYKATLKCSVFPKIFTTAILAGSKFSMAALKRFCSDRTLFHKYKIQNISNNTGDRLCDFLNRKVSLVNFKIRIQDYDNTNNRKDASFEFSDIKPGKYAIAVIHDENCNGKLDTNMFGIPKEGYGFPVVQRSQ
jgi:uncharacterized protein (DUF2141 family)